MIGREKRVLLRHYLEQGLSKAAVARHCGVSERTVYRWIAAGQLDREVDDGPVRYGPRRRSPSKLDPYKGIIETRLAGYPDLSAVRLFEEIREAGYEGGYDQVKRHVREVRPRPPPEPVRRFETPPGHQGQVDFAEFKTPWGKRHALVVVLGYSRLMWVRYYERQTMAVVMEGLESAFRYFGGVPSELLFDQMKAVIVEDNREVGGRLMENPEFLRFAFHWGFRIRACRPYRARTKGKVERPVSYLRRSFFYGRDFVSDDDLNARVQGWLDKVANVRVHGTLKERPVDRFEVERRPLAAQIELRNGRRLEAAMRSSRLPYVKTLATFDFAFQPSIKREQIDALHELGFVERKENVVFLGPPGVGKTHLAISLAITAAESGRKIYFGTLTDLVNSLEEAKAAGRLDRRLKILTHPALLVVDEIGYLPVTQSRAVLFFQLVNRRTATARPCSSPTRASRSGAGSSATRSWPPPSSIGCSTTAIS